jgi:hypothetical protein
MLVTGDMMITSIADAFLIGSGLFLILGFLSLFIPMIRIRQKKRYYFITALLLFVIAFTLGWKDFKAGFNAGFNDGCPCPDEEVSYYDEMKNESVRG